MDLGWCDFCLRVSDVRISKEFYQSLGFRIAEGNLDEGWAVVANGTVRIGLFEKKYMENDPFSLNFRGGDVLAISRELNENGYEFESGPKQSSAGGCSASLRDPDGHLIFFDSAPGETMPNPKD